MRHFRRKILTFWRSVINAEQKAAQGIHDAEEGVRHAAVAAEHKVMEWGKSFLQLEAAGGILLMIAAVAALVIANSPLYGFYHFLLEGMDFRIGFSGHDSVLDAEIRKSILHWINDGMMVVFFFLVGLEIKREFLEGELSSRDRVILPALAAAGGMAVPALCFWVFNRGIPENMAGWAIPSATDIAFALGVIALLGSRVPPALKVLLMAVAVLDDIGAILIIAVFYTEQILMAPLYIALAAVGVLLLLNRKNVTAKTPYFLASAVLWAAVLESGIHATIAGVIAAMFIPMRDRRDESFSPLKTLEHAIHPWVAFCILPLFAFANAGVPFAGMGADDVFNPVSLGIAAGLVVGKQVGVFFMLWLAIVTGLSPRPKGTTWLQLYAVSILCGIGFTMSLFIGTLAYDGAGMQASVRIGVLAGSLVSALGGYLLLRYAVRGKGAVETAQGESA